MSTERGDESSCEGSEFETRAKRALAESLLHVDGRIRSRLTQARHAALAEAAVRPISWWQRPFTALPAAGAVAAAALVATFLWQGEPQHRPITGSAPAALEDAALLTDGETLDMLEDEETAFYEWAVGQS